MKELPQRVYCKHIPSAGVSSAHPIQDLSQQDPHRKTTLQVFHDQSCRELGINNNIYKTLYILVGVLPPRLLNKHFSHSSTNVHFSHYTWIEMRAQAYLVNLEAQPS